VEQVVVAEPKVAVQVDMVETVQEEQTQVLQALEAIQVLQVMQEAQTLVAVAVVAVAVEADITQFTIGEIHHLQVHKAQAVLVEL
jgi:hypothetical protein